MARGRSYIYIRRVPLPLRLPVCLQELSLEARTGMALSRVLTCVHAQRRSLLDRVRLLLTIVAMLPCNSRSMVEAC
jgi:hypothetical protein